MPQNPRSAQMLLGQAEKAWRADDAQPTLTPATQFVPPRPTPAALAAQIRRQVELEQYVDPALAANVFPAQGTEAMLTADRPNLHLAPSNGSQAPRPLINWNELNATLNLAEQHAPVGTTLPEMARFRGIRRKIARFIARIVLTLSRVVTGPQRVFNATMVNGVRDVVESMRQLEQVHRAAFHRLDQRIDREVNKRLAEIEKGLGQVKTALPLQERRITVLLEEVRKRLPAPLAQDQMHTMLQEEDHWLDALYVAFEDQFRGTRDEIKERLTHYLPRLKEGGVGTEEMPILDIGCGRGEWLELLRSQGMHAYGIDINRVLLEQCRQMGLRVLDADLLAHLRGLPDASLGAVTGFHIIEHLPFPVLVKLFDETVRVLKPGGIAIFETPNPENMLVGSCNFYLDPTHQKPCVPLTIQFVAEQRGLVNVEIVRIRQPNQLPNPLEPLPEDHLLAQRLNPLIDLATSRLYGAGDFAIIGRRVK